MTEIKEAQAVYSTTTAPAALSELLQGVQARLRGIEEELAAVKEAMLELAAGAGAGDSLQTAPRRRAPTIRTEHPHIIRTENFYGGWPHIEGHRIPVFSVVDLYLSGMTVEQIMEDYPTLTTAKIHAALAYYYDHQTEIDTQIADAYDEEKHKEKIKHTFPPEILATIHFEREDGRSIRERFNLRPEDTPCPNVEEIIARLKEDPEAWRDL